MKKRILISVLAVVVLVLLILRMLLPGIIKRTLNTRLAALDGPFCGKVGDVDLHIIRGAYEVQDLEILAKDKAFVHCDKTLLSVQSLRLSLSWGELFHGKLRLDVTLDRPTLAADPFFETLNRSNPKDEATHPTKGAESAWNALIPWRIDSLRILHGTVYFSLFGAGGVATPIENLEAEIAGIEMGRASARPVLFRAKANILKDSLLLVAGSADFTVAPIRWDLDISAEGVNLTKANPFLIQRVPVTFTSGIMDLYGEMGGQGDNMHGYAKTLFSHMDVISSREVWKSFTHGLIEIISGLVFTFLENPKLDTTGTEIDFTRDAGGFHFDVGKAISRAIAHRAGKPVPAGMEHRLNLPLPNRKE